MALQVDARLFACRAVREWDVVVSDIVEKVDFIFLQHQTGGDGVHGCVTPALVEETAIFVKVVEVVCVGLGAEPIQVADFEVRPL